MKNYGSAIGTARTQRARPKNKISWRERLASWLVDTDTDLPIYVNELTQTPSIDRGNGTVTFTVHPASGGYVVESTYYDERKDRHERNLHIITSQEDFSEELGKAVFMDILKNR